MKATFLAAIAGLLTVAGLVRAEEARTSSSVSTGAPYPCDAGCDSRYWFSAEYLLWVIKNAPAGVPLVASGSPVGNLQPVLGQPGQTVVIGGADVDSREHSGARFTFGGWIDNERTMGVEGSFFFLSNHSVSQTVSSNGAANSPALSLPFFNVTIPGESSTQISSPGSFAGTASLTVASRLQNWELNGVANLVHCPHFRLDAIGGFRVLHLAEDLRFDTSSPNVVGTPDVFRTHDEFDTRNSFYGGQLGLRGEYRCGPIFVQGSGKIALGDVHESVNVNGMLATTDLNNQGLLQTFPGGYLALPTNIGTASRDRFAAMPEATVNVGYQFTDRFRGWVGYTFLYVSDVARPGDQIDRGINPSQAPAITGTANSALTGVARPALLLRSTDFWAQGVSFGLELRF